MTLNLNYWELSPREMFDLATETDEPQILADLADFEEYIVHLAIARNTYTNYKTLEKLATSFYAIIRRYVARHANTTPSTLDFLSRDPDHTVRAAVAENPHTSPETRECLQNDPNYEVRMAAYR